MKKISDCDGLDCRNLSVIDELEAEKGALLAACKQVYAEVGMPNALDFHLRHSGLAELLRAAIAQAEEE